ncbi:hypothetical protein [Streptomyces caniscabiei]|uniref:hypothetical protein n=1 Tax=Streptomyces caniscabiei TaxID=2746961 RepID=UPI0029AC6851|nr:hypothetical protein [Streptomyces caniscabiei]MDX2986518.1 hypothetical protein [Streptomyces caniscabiei]
MAKTAKITHIITGSERANDGVGLAFDQATHEREAKAAAESLRVSEETLKDLAKKRAQARAEAATARDTSNDRTYGPGQPDGMGPKRWWQRG